MPTPDDAGWPYPRDAPVELRIGRAALDEIQPDASLEVLRHACSFSGSHTASYKGK